MTPGPIITPGGDYGRSRDRIESKLQRPLPNARVYNNANISIPNNTITALTFNSERWDNGSTHSTSASTHLLTAPVTGIYLIGAHVQWANSAAGERYLDLLTGAGAIALVRQSPTSAGNCEQQVSTMYRMLAGDTVQVRAFQSSGGALSVLTASNYSPEFWMVRLGGYVNEGIN